MAEITSNNHPQKGGRRSKKLSTRVDLTPMVDLGFLLITFFVFTTSMTRPTALKLNLPSDKPTNNPTQVPASKVMTILLHSNNQIIGYRGDWTDAVNKNAFFFTDFSMKGIGEQIMQAKKDIRQQFGSDSGFVLIVKPGANSNYKNMVDAIDLTLIHGIKKHAMVQPDAAEIEHFGLVENE
jgi:biopolymer transport protein ExbD